MWARDYSQYEYLPGVAVEGVCCVGWLSSDQDYRRASADPTLVTKLIELFAREEVNIARGTHYCELCRTEESLYEIQGKSMRLGMSEIWVPDPEADIVYAAPSLVIHYCADHFYDPGDRFCKAVLAFDLASAWSGEQELARRPLIDTRR